MSFSKVFLLMILSFLSPALAEESKETASPIVVEGSKETTNRVIAKKSTNKRGRVVKIDFDDELLIKGKVLGPSLFTLYQKRNVEFGRLIKPRKDFLPEMRVTLGDIK